MKIYRICLSKWADKLTASGYPARWNSKGTFVIYTAGTRALACLENVVHRGGEGLNQNFKVMIINLPEKIKIAKIRLQDLPEDWMKYENYSVCQKIGDEWIRKRQAPILRVPSSIINMEYNYLINPNHPDFATITLEKTENFKFDPRIKKT